jgi:phosphatidylserine decarboxylase
LNSITYAFLWLLPKNAASRAFGALTRFKIPVLSKVLRDLFCRH